MVEFGVAISKIQITTDTSLRLQTQVPEVLNHSFVEEFLEAFESGFYVLGLT